MIQRKQSLWLLIAALLNIGVLFLDLFRWHEPVNGVDTLQAIRAGNHFPTLLIVLVLVLLPVVNIFMFKTRKRQMNMVIFNILAICGFVALLLSRVSHTNKDIPASLSGSYWIGAVLPVASLLFLILAIAGIRKDDKLVKSMDRLR